MGCPESLELLRKMSARLEAIELELTVDDSQDLPGNTLQKIPRGWGEDIKRFSVAAVAAADVGYQIAEMTTAKYYIIKEVRYYASGTPSADASHAIRDTDTAIYIANGYYNEGSFSILTGNKNGIFGHPLNKKPTVVLNSGTGALAQTWYCSIKYYYR